MLKKKLKKIKKICLVLKWLLILENYNENIIKNTINI